jgi:hypothetical protein
MILTHLPGLSVAVQTAKKAKAGYRYLQVTVEINSCNGGGHGSAKDNYVQLLVYVDKIDFEDCHYKPSLRIPRSLKVRTPW